MGAAVKNRQWLGKGGSSASQREKQCQSKGEAVPVKGSSSASQREGQCQSKGEAVPVKVRSSASQREEQCQSKGEAMPVKGRSSASQREEQCRSKGGAVPVKGQHITCSTRLRQVDCRCLKCSPLSTMPLRRYCSRVSVTAPKAGFTSDRARSKSAISICQQEKDLIYQAVQCTHLR